jgi:hypothetical protein
MNMTLGSPDPTPPGAGCSASSCRSSASTKRPAPALTWTEVWSGRSDFRPQSHRANPGRCSSERPPKKGDLVIMPVIKIIRSSQKLPHGVDQGNGARVVKAIGDVHPIWEEVDHPASATRASGTHGPRSSTRRSVPPGPGHCESLSPWSIDDMSLPLLGIRRPHSVQVGAVS